MLRKTILMKRSATLVLLVLGLSVGAAWAQKESVLYSFCAQTNCADGAEPYAALVFDQKRNLYGTTEYGGSLACQNSFGNGCGVVFKLDPAGKETVLYTFCAQTDCTDGATPLAGLVFDQKGNLYGTTEYGGAHGAGVVFKLTPKGKETVLYSFCKHNNCTDGYYPAAGLVSDTTGNLYGATQSGGTYGGGVVFRLTPNGKETVLYSFCAQTNCADGEGPVTGLIFDQKGNLFGTTPSGGDSRFGVVFKLTPEGEEKVLYSFCPPGFPCNDGALPNAGLVLDRKGNLYGTTEWGGNSFNCNYPDGCGVVFKLTPAGKETVLYTFCPQSCTDGAFPFAGLVFDQKGNLFGTTQSGGVNASSQGGGVVFKLTPGGRETVLHSFCAQTNCADGANPYAGPVFDQKGNLYGTTVSGGAYNAGVAFKLTP